MRPRRSARARVRRPSRDAGGGHEDDSSDWRSIQERLVTLRTGPTPMGRSQKLRQPLALESDAKVETTGPQRSRLSAMRSSRPTGELLDTV